MYVRRRPLGPEATEIVRGMPTTTVLQTLLDIARDCPLAFSVAVLDSAVRDFVVSLDDVEKYWKTHPARTGGRRIAWALANVDRRRETVAESVCAIRFGEHSITGFEPQVSIYDDFGRFLARPDFVNRHAKVVAEFDGAGKYYLENADPKQAFELERRREYAMRNEGWMVFRIRWSDLFSPDVFLRIKEAVRRREVTDTAIRREA
jgi:very-short-patch-repair endonuclease